MPDWSVVTILVCVFSEPSLLGRDGNGEPSNGCPILLLGYDKEKVLLILNRYSAKNVLETEALEKSFDYPAFWKIPNQTYANVLNSISQGTPITQMMPKSKLGISFFKLVYNLNGGAENSENINEKNKKGRIINRLLKK